MDTTNTSKSLLAKLLATENIIIRHNTNAKTASFDVKRRVLELPIWKDVSEDLHDMLVVHEVGHALDTKYDDWMKAINTIIKNVYGEENKSAVGPVRSFLNVVEDARIDSLQKRRYPGTRRNYLFGYRELNERNFFGVKDKDLNSLGLIDRINLYFKGNGTNPNLKFSPSERPFIYRMERLETFDEVVAIAEELFRLAKEQQEQQEQQEEQQAEAGSTPNGGDGNIEDVIEELFGENDDMDSFLPPSSASGEKTKDEDEIPYSKTEEYYEQMRENLANDDIHYAYVKFPVPFYDRIIHDFPKFLEDHKNFYATHKSMFDENTEGLKEFRQKETATISFMVKEFEMRKAADAYARQSIAKTGVIDTNKLHTYRFNDDIFRRYMTVPNGKNHGFVMVIDWSGSMADNMKHTMRQLMSLTLFCKRVNIPFEVYLFRNTYNGYDDHPSFEVNYNNTINASNMVMRNILSSRMNASQFNDALHYLWAAAHKCPNFEQMGNTPLNEAIMVSDKIVNDFRKANKLQNVNVIFLTDGDSNHNRVPGFGLSGYKNSKGKAIRNVVIAQDDQTKKSYFPNLENNYNNGLTTMLLQRLKDRTNCTLTGFFLYKGNFTSMMGKFYPSNNNPEYAKNLMDSWSKNNFVAINNAGYDEYYVLNPKGFKPREEEMNIESGMTKGKMFKNFSKFVSSKTVNRVLLSRFMEKTIGKINNAA